MLANNPIIRSFEIIGLFGERHISLNCDDPCTILVGENGLGKTTILAILNCVLSGSLQGLIKYEFEKIIVQLCNSEEIFSFDKKFILQYCDKLHDIAQDTDEEAFFKLEKIIVGYDINNLNRGKINYIAHADDDIRKGIEGYMFDIGWAMEDMLLKFPSVYAFKHLLAKANFELLYLPTYRRIEKDIDEAVADSRYIQDLHTPPREKLVRQYIEAMKENIGKQNSLFNFGMSDIQDNIDRICNEIKDMSVKGFSEVYGNMLNILLSQNEMPDDEVAISNEEIGIILKRVGKSLSDVHKNSIINLISSGKIADNKYLLYFLQSLAKEYRKIRKYDITLKNFTEACNRFLFNKEYLYDERDVELGIYLNHDGRSDKPIFLKDLSSGEKQLVSMLAKVFLNPEKRLVILIDEPELSLSIKWQEKLLPTILESPSCVQLVAVTQSPFIFNNPLLKRTFGPKEYFLV